MEVIAKVMIGSRIGTRLKRTIRIALGRSKASTRSMYNRLDMYCAALTRISR